MLQINTIINSKNQELLANNGLHLSRLTETSQNDSKTLVSIASDSSHDSQTTRIATIIAMVYLPASLVLVSSILTQQNSILFIANHD